MTEDQIGVLATCCIIFLLALAVHAFFVVGKFAVMIIRVFFSVWLRWAYRFRPLRQELFYCIYLRGCT